MKNNAKILRENVAYNLKSYRKIFGITQEEFASSLGISRQRLGSYEEQRALPKIGMAITIAEKMKIEVNDFLSRKSIA